MRRWAALALPPPGGHEPADQRAVEPAERHQHLGQLGDDGAAHRARRGHRDHGPLRWWATSSPTACWTPWINNSVRALSAADPSALVLSGPKVDSFMENLRGNVEEVTNDAWMANFAAVDQKAFGGRLNAKATDPGKISTYLAMSAARARGGLPPHQADRRALVSSRGAGDGLDLGEDPVRNCRMPKRAETARGRSSKMANCATS